MYSWRKGCVSTHSRTTSLTNVRLGALRGRCSPALSFQRNGDAFFPLRGTFNNGKCFLLIIIVTSSVGHWAHAHLALPWAFRVPFSPPNPLRLLSPFHAWENQDTEKLNILLNITHSPGFEPHTDASRAKRFPVLQPPHTSTASKKRKHCLTAFQEKLLPP